LLTISVRGALPKVDRKGQGRIRLRWILLLGYKVKRKEIGRKTAPRLSWLSMLLRLSENVFKSELHLAHRPGRSDLSESGRLNIGGRRIVIRMVDEIERFEAELERVPFANP